MRTLYMTEMDWNEIDAKLKEADRFGHRRCADLAVGRGTVMDIYMAPTVLCPEIERGSMETDRGTAEFRTLEAGPDNCVVQFRFGSSYLDWHIYDREISADQARSSLAQLKSRLESGLI
jgi:hypothetical protein